MYSSGDVRFNKDDLDSSYEMSITLENDSGKVLAYAERKSVSFSNQYMIIYLQDAESNYLDECRVRSGEECNFGEEVMLSAGDYTVVFLTSEKHTWNLWAEIQ